MEVRLDKSWTSTVQDLRKKVNEAIEKKEPLELDVKDLQTVEDVIQCMYLACA